MAHIYEITTQNTENNIKKILEQMKNAMTKYIRKEFAQTAIDECLTVYYATKLIGTEYTIAELMKNHNHDNMIDDDVIDSIRNENWKHLYEQFYIMQVKRIISGFDEWKKERDSIDIFYPDDTTDIDITLENSRYSYIILDQSHNADAYIIEHNGKTFIMYNGIWTVGYHKADIYALDNPLYVSPPESMKEYANIIFDNIPDIKEITCETDIGYEQYMTIYNKYALPILWKNEPEYRKMTNEKAISLFDTTAMKIIPDIKDDPDVKRQIETQKESKTFINMIEEFCERYDPAFRIGEKDEIALWRKYDYNEPLELSHAKLFEKCPFVLTMDEFIENLGF